jgi:hypothetical protein
VKRAKQPQTGQTGQTETNRAKQAKRQKNFSFLKVLCNRMPNAWFWQGWWPEKIAEKPPFAFGFFDLDELL